MDKIDIKIFSTFVKNAHSSLLTSLWVRIRKELKSKNTSTAPPAVHQIEFLTADELAKMLKVSRRFIETNTACGRIPGQIKIGRLWRYRKSAIMRALIGGQFLIINDLNK